VQVQIIRIVKSILFRIKCLYEYIYYTLQKNIRSIRNRNLYEKVRILKNSYVGERVFLIGTGPSLNDEDILKLRKEYTFGLNSIAIAQKKLKFFPTFYGFTDGGIVDDKLFGKEVFSNNKSIIFYTQMRDLKRKDVIELRRKSNAYELLMKDPGNWINFVKMPKLFSEDVSKEVYWGYTCAYVMMQVIVYLGFKEVYLLGMDCIYAPGIENYEDKRSAEEVVNGDCGGGTVPEFMYAWNEVKKYSEKNGIKIYNVTRGGMLDIFERKTMEEILGS